jgi:hypothetical protein
MLAGPRAKAMSSQARGVSSTASEEDLTSSRTHVPIGEGEEQQMTQAEDRIRAGIRPWGRAVEAHDPLYIYIEQTLVHS